MPGSTKSSKSSKSPSLCSQDNVTPLQLEDNISTFSVPSARPLSSDSTKPLSAREKPSSVSLMNLSFEDPSLRRRQLLTETDQEDDTNDQTNRNQPIPSSSTSTSARQDAGTSSVIEKAAVLNLGNQSDGLDTDPIEGIPLKKVSPRYRPHSLVISYHPITGMYNYAPYSELLSPDEMPPKPTTVAAEIHGQPKDTTNETRSHQNEPMSVQIPGTSSGTGIPASSLATRPDPENLPQLQPRRSIVDLIEAVPSPEHTTAQNVSNDSPPITPKKLPSWYEVFMKIVLKLEPFLYLFFVGLVLGIVFLNVFEYNRIHSSDYPLYFNKYNLTRPLCIEKKDYTWNCLLKTQTQNLNRNGLEECLNKMKETFEDEFCKPNTPDKHYDQVGGICDGKKFFRKLTDSDDTTNVYNALKYTTCLRIFEKNPFGEVSVKPINETAGTIIRHNFGLKNYKLMIECKIISPDSIFKHLKNPNKVISLMIWISGFTILVVFVNGVVRFHRSAKEIGPR